MDLKHSQREAIRKAGHLYTKGDDSMTAVAEGISREQTIHDRGEHSGWGAMVR
jgi:hypothetical protein